ncbi:MAG TPA: hypothetical protein VF792_00965 [Ktedonobacterales bacterium]
MDSGAGDTGARNEAGDGDARRAALRAMAQSSQQTTIDDSAPPSRPAPTLTARFTPPPRSRWRLLVSGVSILVVVAVVGVVVANILGLGRAHTAAPKPITRLNMAGSGLTCVMSVAWSPDSTRIALLGSTGQDCGGSVSDFPSTLVAIYDARSGKLVSQLHPDTPVFGAPEVKAILNGAANPDHAPGVANYNGITWAPDGQSLLTLFGVGIFQPANQSPNTGNSSAPAGVDGLLRLHVSGAAQTTLWFDKPNPSFHLSGAVTPRWDTVKGVVEYVPQPTAATAYSWNADGSLTPMDATADGPVGQPDGGKSFTIWQTGQMQIAYQHDDQTGQETPVPQDILWGLQGQVVSSDGRYLYPYVGTIVSLVPPSTKQVYAKAPTFQPHDKAQLALATQLTQLPLDAGLFNNYGQTQLSWRADGRVLAYLSSQHQSNPSGGMKDKTTISLYDTSTGALLKVLVPDVTGLQTTSFGNIAMAWSPDGSRLLYMDNTYGAITIWGPGALPK